MLACAVVGLIDPEPGAIGGNGREWAADSYQRPTFRPGFDIRRRRLIPDITQHVDDVYNSLSAQANALYPQAYLAQLFKSQQKLTTISKAMA